MISVPLPWIVEPHWKCHGILDPATLSNKPGLNVAITDQTPAKNVVGFVREDLAEFIVDKMNEVCDDPMTPEVEV